MKHMDVLMETNITNSITNMLCEINELGIYKRLFIVLIPKEEKYVLKMKMLGIIIIKRIKK